MFAKIGAFSFGGGYVMIPIMLRELELHGFKITSRITDVIAISSMSPGPIALNAAAGLGYIEGAFPYSLAALLGILIPNCIIVILAASFFFKIYRSKYITAAFYGLRPVIAGIILYAAVNFALKNGIIGATSDKIIKNGFNVFAAGTQIFELKSTILAAVVFITLLKTKVHPIYVIILSGVIGSIIF